MGSAFFQGIDGQRFVAPDWDLQLLHAPATGSRLEPGEPDVGQGWWLAAGWDWAGGAN